MTQTNLAVLKIDNGQHNLAFPLKVESASSSEEQAAGLNSKHDEDKGILEWNREKKQRHLKKNSYLKIGDVRKKISGFSREALLINKIHKISPYRQRKTFDFKELIEEQKSHNPSPQIPAGKEQHYYSFYNSHQVT